MSEEQKQNLYNRNNKIIEIILNEINNSCPNCVDMIGIGGSFCNGDIYENSDLDLVIVVNDEKAKVLNKCFILENIGFDVYTQDWNHFGQMADYSNPYVTKLIDLNIVYTRNNDVLNKYLLLQQKVKENMENEKIVNNNIGIYFNNVLKSYDSIKNIDDISFCYKNLATLINQIEYIIYMINRTYVKKGTKRIPEEISNMKILPNNFLDTYLNITKFNGIDDIRNKSLILVESVKRLLDEHNITYNLINNDKIEEIVTKKTINSNDLTGTYEEIYSNWKNKMYHAININSSYLSFMTMASCQSFYDEMANEFDIEKIDLIGKYNSNDLEGNAKEFDKAMVKWKELYDLFNKNIVKFNSLEELNNLYKK